MLCSVPAGAYQASTPRERAGRGLFGFWNKIPGARGMTQPLNITSPSCTPRLVGFSDFQFRQHDQAA